MSEFSKQRKLFLHSDCDLSLSPSLSTAVKSYVQEEVCICTYYD